MSFGQDFNVINEIEKLFESLYTLYYYGNNCDLHLISEDHEEFFVHAFVLAANIPKLRESILGPLENVMKNKKIKISNVNGRELRLIIQFAYLNRCDLQEDAECALELLIASLYLGITNLKAQCHEVLLRTLDVATAARILSSSVGQNMIVQEVAELMLLSHLTTANSVDIAVLPYTKMLNLLRDDRLHAPFEEQALETVFCWVAHNPSLRRKKLPDLLHSLRLGYLAPETMRKLKQHPLVTSDTYCLAILQAAKSTFKEFLQFPHTSESLPPSLCPRMPHASIFVIEGYGLQGPTKSIQVYDNIAEHWSELLHLQLPQNRMFCGVQKVGDSLYVIGGSNNTTEFTNSCLKLCLRTMKWQQISPMTEARCYIACAVLEGNIYAVGGRSYRGRLKSVEKYSPATDEWTHISDLPEKRSDAGIAVLNGKLYLVGGFDGETRYDSVTIYNSVKNVWMRGPTLNDRRVGASCAVVDGHIYAIGGSYQCEHGKINRHSSVECLNPETNTWCIVAPMNIGRSNATAVVLDHRIFIFGGYTQDCITDLAEVYDTKADKWYQLPNMPGARSGLSACVVQDIVISDKIWGTGIHRNNPILLRDLTRQRPRHHSSNLDNYYKSNMEFESQLQTWTDQSLDKAKLLRTWRNTAHSEENSGSLSFNE